LDNCVWNSFRIHEIAFVLDNHAALIILTSSNMVQGMIRIGPTHGGGTQNHVERAIEPGVNLALASQPINYSGLSIDEAKDGSTRLRRGACRDGRGRRRNAIGANGGWLLLFGVKTGQKGRHGVLIRNVDIIGGTRIRQLGENGPFRLSRSGPTEWSDDSSSLAIIVAQCIFCALFRHNDHCSRQQWRGPIIVLNDQRK
jgi:hypothetical protein